MPSLPARRSTRRTNGPASALLAMVPWATLPLAMLAACAAPGATALEPGPVAAAFAMPAPELLDARAAELPVEPLELEDVRGARIVFALPGTPQQVLAMLLDFAHADGHRAWAEHYELLSREGDRTVARWQFRGRMGVHPKVQLVFEVERPSPESAGGAAGANDDVLVRFRLLEPAFGLAAFFGDYRVRALPGAGDAPRSVLAARVFIDSGIVFTNASAEDLERGQREDAKKMRAWMRERLGLPAGPDDDANEGAEGAGTTG